MKTSLKFLFTGIASLAVVTGLSVVPASAELSAVDTQTDKANSANSPETGYPLATGGFPRWYEDYPTPDRSALRLDLCTDQNGFCLFDPPNAGPVSFSDNFPDEAFWWTAEASQNGTVVLSNGRRRAFQARLVLATEAAFANEEVFDGDQVAFNRIRVRVQGLEPGFYKVTHPYGVEYLESTAKKGINFTNDFICNRPVRTLICSFDDLTVEPTRSGLQNPVGRPWLTWDNFNTNSGSSDLVESGIYAGNPNIGHAVIGSPNDTNYFMVERTVSRTNRTVVGSPIFTQLDFFVSGKVSTTP